MHLYIYNISEAGNCPEIFSRVPYALTPESSSSLWLPSLLHVTGPRAWRRPNQKQQRWGHPSSHCPAPHPPPASWGLWGLWRRWASLQGWMGGEGDRHSASAFPSWINHWSLKKKKKRPKKTKQNKKTPNYFHISSSSPCRNIKFCVWSHINWGEIRQKITHIHNILQNETFC